MSRRFLIYKLCGFNDWVWNDLRGLVATRLKRPLMVDSEIINRVQGRLDQSILGRHYDANDYLADKASALQKWANCRTNTAEGDATALTVEGVIKNENSSATTLAKAEDISIEVVTAVERLLGKATSGGHRE